MHAGMQVEPDPLKHSLTGSDAIEQTVFFKGTHDHELKWSGIDTHNTLEK